MSKKRSRVVLPFNKQGKGKLLDADKFKKANDHGDGCAICSKDYGKYGNNGDPVVDGLVCDQCNTEKVIPARLAKMFDSEDKIWKIDADGYKYVPGGNYIIHVTNKENGDTFYVGKDIPMGFDTVDTPEEARVFTDPNAIRNIEASGFKERFELIPMRAAESNKALDAETGAEDADIKAKLKEVDAKIKTAISEGNQKDYDKLSNERNKLTKELMTLNSKKKSKKALDEDILALSTEELEILTKALPKLIQLLSGEAELEIEEELEPVEGNEGVEGDEGDFEDLESQMNEDLEENKLNDESDLGDIIKDPQKKAALKKILTDSAPRRRLNRKKAQDSVSKVDFTSVYESGKPRQKLNDNNIKDESKAMSDRFK